MSLNNKCLGCFRRKSQRSLRLSWSAQWARCWFACSLAMCCYVVSKLVIKSCTEPLRASQSRWYYAQSSSCFVIGPWSPAVTLWQTFVYPFRNSGVNTFDWKRNSFSCPSPFQSLNDLALSRADMIHTTINVGHVMYLQPANFRGLHARPSFRPRLSVSHVCLAYRGLSWRHVKFAWRKT